MEAVHLKPQLHVIFGPMFSGKTTKLVEELTRFADLGFRVCYINSTIDVRTETALSTHNSSLKLISNKITCQKFSSLNEVEVEKYDVIGIDECQFFSNLQSHVKDWLKHNNKVVIVAGLKADFKGDKFGELVDLIPIAGRCTMLHANCDICILSGNVIDAPHTGRKDLRPSATNVDVGSKNKYMALCNEHFFATFHN